MKPYAATKWVAEHGHEINVDGKRLPVVGNSVGGTIATVTALKCKLEGGPVLKAQILFWPGTDTNFERSSYNEYAEGYLLTKSMVQWFWDNNVPDHAQRREVYASPLQASIEQLKNLPPAHVKVAGNDVVWDEGVAYARKLDAARGRGHAGAVRWHDPRLRNAELSQPGPDRSHSPCTKPRRN